MLKKSKTSKKTISREERLLKKVERDEKKLVAHEEKIEKEEKNIQKLEKKIIKDEEKILFELKKLTVKKKHLLDLIKIIAGALLGTSFGSGLLGKKELAMQLPWVNVIGIFLLTFIVASLLVYKSERKNVVKGKSVARYVVLRVLYIWIVATVISSLASILFMTETLESAILIKSLLIGSYPAVAGAIGFSFI
jgi:uncharacterized membrane protein